MGGGGGWGVESRKNGGPADELWIRSSCMDEFFCVYPPLTPIYSAFDL